MNVNYAWKILSGLSWFEMLLIVVLLAGTIMVASIALWNAIPLAFDYLIDIWRRYVRRRARRQWRTTRDRSNAPSRAEREAPFAASGGGLSPNAWLAVAGCSAVSILGGVAIGYVLNRQPDHSTMSARLTEVAHDPAQLRIDYELRPKIVHRPR